jgi:RNA polymerase sigma-70 factor (ECF subfamily)
MDTLTEGSRGGASSPSSISSTLLERIRARRPEAWQRLVDLYGPLVYRWARQLGVSSADAADIAQEVFAAVSAHLDQFRRDRPEHSFGAWLRTITRNKIRDHYRQRQSPADAEGGTHAYQQLLELAESAEESSMGTNAGTDTGFLRRMLDLVRVEFENRTWEAFWRLVVDGQSPADVAAAMGLSLPAVYKAKSRVLRRLRQELHDLGE